MGKEAKTYGGYVHFIFSHCCAWLCNKNYDQQTYFIRIVVSLGNFFLLLIIENVREWVSMCLFVCLLFVVVVALFFFHRRMRPMRVVSTTEIKNVSTRKIKMPSFVLGKNRLWVRRVHLWLVSLKIHIEGTYFCLILLKNVRWFILKIC